MKLVPTGIWALKILIFVDLQRLYRWISLHFGHIVNAYGKVHLSCKDIQQPDAVALVALILDKAHKLHELASHLCGFRYPQPCRGILGMQCDPFSRTMNSNLFCCY
jgi:hypothetical protein